MLLPVIMAGGTGSRLWPMSRELYPKQFLRLFGQNSMLQETITRLSGLEIHEPMVICNEEHRFLVAEQLRQLNKLSNNIILEPVGRNTAPAIAQEPPSLVSRHSPWISAASRHQVMSFCTLAMMLTPTSGHCSSPIQSPYTSVEAFCHQPDLHYIRFPVHVPQCCLSDRRPRHPQAKNFLSPSMCRPCTPLPAQTDEPCYRRWLPASWETPLLHCLPRCTIPCLMA